MIYLNDRAWLFGGKSINNLNDVKSLKIVDDSEKYWKAYQIDGENPDERFSHSMSGFHDRYLIIFGGAANQVFKQTNER